MSVVSTKKVQTYEKKNVYSTAALGVECILFLEDFYKSNTFFLETLTYSCIKFPFLGFQGKLMAKYSCIQLSIDRLQSPYSLSLISCLTLTTLKSLY